MEHDKSTTDKSDNLAKELNTNMALRVSCGQFSYAETPKRYSIILGVTGTLEVTLKLPFEKKILEDEMKITEKTFMPSMFGENKLNFLENEHVYVENDKGAFYCKIGEEARKRSEEGRPVLVFFDSETDLRGFRDSEYGTKAFAVGLVDELTASTPNKPFYINKAKEAKKITLSTREFGRGIDFKSPSPEVDAKGGIHVVQTFLSEEPSEEVQIQGRTARMGKEGSYRLVLHGPSLSKFDIELKDIAEKKKGGIDEAGKPVSVYSFLCEKRVSFLERGAETRHEAANAAKALNVESAGFQQHLVAGNVEPCWKFLNESNRMITSGECRLLLLSDATGSMRSLWDGTKNQVTEMLSRIAKVSGEKNNISVQWVAYRDYDCEGSATSPLIESSGWKNDPSEIIRWLGKVACTGGGDGPEAVEKALEFANRLDEDEMPSRILLFADAPPHEEETGQIVEYHKRRMDTNYKDECKKLKAREVPVFSFYMDSYAKTEFETISSMTGGKAEELELGKDNKQLLDAVCLQALDQIGGEKLTTKYKAQYL
jgi:hypothetical protein